MTVRLWAQESINYNFYDENSSGWFDMKISVYEKVADTEKDGRHVEMYTNHKNDESQWM